MVGRFREFFLSCKTKLKIPSQTEKLIAHLADFIFPSSSPFSAFPWSRGDAIDATPMHKPPPPGLSCFHESAPKQGAAQSIRRHRENRSLSLDVPQFRPLRNFATYIRRMHIYPLAMR